MCSKRSQNHLKNSPKCCFCCNSLFSCFTAAQMSWLAGEKRISQIFLKIMKIWLIWHRPILRSDAADLDTCCRCQGRCNYLKSYSFQRHINFLQNELKTTVIASKIRELQLKTESRFMQIFSFVKIYVVKFILWRRGPILSLHSVFALDCLFFEIFEKFFFLLLAKTFVQL